MNLRFQHKSEARMFFCATEFEKYNNKKIHWFRITQLLLIFIALDCCFLVSNHLFIFERFSKDRRKHKIFYGKCQQSSESVVNFILR